MNKKTDKTPAKKPAASQKGRAKPKKFKTPSPYDKTPVIDVSTAREDTARKLAENKETHILTDDEFWRILALNDGYFNKTAQAIQLQYGVEMRRQSVNERAQTQPDRLRDIIESRLDKAEETMAELMSSDDNRIRFESSRFTLLTQGKNRGYTLRQEITGGDGGAVQVSLSVEQWREQSQQRTNKAENLLKAFEDDGDATAIDAEIESND